MNPNWQRRNQRRSKQYQMINYWITELNRLTGFVPEHTPIWYGVEHAFLPRRVKKYALAQYQMVNDKIVRFGEPREFLYYNQFIIVLQSMCYALVVKSSV